MFPFNANLTSYFITILEWGSFIYELVLCLFIFNSVL